MPFLLADREGMEPDDLLCSRNARPEKALVGRESGRPSRPPPVEKINERRAVRLKRLPVPFPRLQFARTEGELLHAEHLTFDHRPASADK